jgi:hypothetical protein
MKLVGITTAGTYYSPWFPYTLASIYRICDNIVVVNGGYDLKNPNNDRYNIPLNKVHQDIQELDVNGKIVEVRDTTNDGCHRKHNLKTQVESERDHDSDFYDVRGFNLTVANVRAMDIGAEWVLKIDTDQALYNDATEIRNNIDSWNLYQYEFITNLKWFSHPNGEYCYNDSVFTYRPDRNDTYRGGGAPAIIHDDRKNTDRFHSAHLRQSNPEDLPFMEKFEHFKGRTAFSLFTNKYGSWSNELFEEAGQVASVRMSDGFPMTPAYASPPEVLQVSRDKLRNWLS